MIDCQKKEARFNKNKYTTEKERYQIEVLLKDGKSKKDIATLIGKSVRTIQREFKRGLVEMLSSTLVKKVVYCADFAQKDYEEKKKNKGANFKIGNDHALVKHIEIKISKDKYSPDAVIGEIKRENYKFKTSICTKTLYNYINANLFLHITNKDLLIKKNPKKDYHKIKRLSLKNQKGRSISERPKNVDLRDVIGHWEADCVVGKRDYKEVLLVLTERCSRKTLIFKMLNKTQESVKSVLDKLEKQYGDKFKKYFKTITMDNGTEFINQQLIEKSCLNDALTRTTAYYAHPYSSWERGSNENTNKMIRRFIPKGTDISQYTEKEIKRIESWINNYPRKLFNYATAEMIYNEKLNELPK